MPEYLAPAVYVEEIDSGNKPIEGVSTSTAGMIGITERGPANVPILVTSYGEYVRWFGARLNRTDFGDHCYLPACGRRLFHQRRQTGLYHAGGGKRRNPRELRTARSRRRRLGCHVAAAPRSRGYRHYRAYADLCSRYQYTWVRAHWRTVIASAWEMTAMRNIGLSIKIEPAASTTHVPLVFR